MALGSVFQTRCRPWSSVGGWAGDWERREGLERTGACAAGDGEGQRGWQCPFAREIERGASGRVNRLFEKTVKAGAVGGRGSDTALRAFWSDSCGGGDLILCIGRPQRWVRDRPRCCGCRQEWILLGQRWVPFELRWVLLQQAWVRLRQAWVPDAQRWVQSGQQWVRLRPAWVRFRQMCMGS